MKSNFYEGIPSYFRLSICIFFILLCVSNTLHATPPVAYITEEWENSRYIDNGDDTITDKRTLLMWKQCTEGVTTESGEHCNSGTDAITYQWSGALTHAENHSFGGYNDWRLPNVKELQSLVAYNRTEPTINGYIFPETSLGYYWTGTIIGQPSFWGSFYINGSRPTWAVDFSNGKTEAQYRILPGVAYIRLVRDAL